MARGAFRISGPIGTTRSSRSRARERGRRERAVHLALGGAALVALGLVEAAPPAPSARIGDAVLSARHVLVLADTSGSMTGSPAKQAAQQRLIAELARQGPAISVAEFRGPGTTEAGPAGNLRHVLVEALEPHPTVDAVYLFSDFRWDDGLDYHDEEGLAWLRSLLARKGAPRLFLGTVELDPSTSEHAGLVEVAEASGGGVIRSPTGAPD